MKYQNNQNSHSACLNFYIVLGLNLVMHRVKNSLICFSEIEVYSKKNGIFEKIVVQKMYNSLWYRSLIKLSSTPVARSNLENDLKFMLRFMKTHFKLNFVACFAHLSFYDSEWYNIDLNFVHNIDDDLIYILCICIVTSHITDLNWKIEFPTHTNYIIYFNNTNYVICILHS